MSITVYSEPTVFQELAPEWNELLKRSAGNRIFSTLEWLSHWWQAYHPGDLWVLAMRDMDNRLIALAPWFIENHPQYGRVVRSIGCVDVTDYLDLIIDANCLETVYHHLADFVAEQNETFDVIDLCNLPEASPTLKHFTQTLKEVGFSVEIAQQEVCPIINLPDTWDGYLALLNKKDRHELRRKMRRTENCVETVSWHIVNEQDDIEAALRRFIELMATSHPDKAKFLADSQNADFFQAITHAAFERGWLQLAFLTVDGTAAAGYLNFDYDGRILVYNSGLLPNEYGHLSPGIVLLGHLIEQAIDTGHTVFDFLRGDEIYKYRLGGQDTPVFMLRAQLEK